MRIPLIALAVLSLLPQPGAARQAPVVRADGAPAWGHPLRLERELRIGAIDGPLERTFGRVTGVAVTVAGDIWVADAQAAAIRRFDASGRYLGSAGGRGEGPGEFQDLAGVHRMPDGRIVAWDARLARLSYFDASGAYLESVRVPVALMVGSAQEALRVDDEGSVWVLSAAFSPPDPAPRLFYLRLRAAGPPDTIPIPSANVRGPQFGGRFYPFAMMLPFSTATHSAFSPSGHLVTGRNDRYALSTRTRDGALLRIERSYSPVAVQRAERRERERLGEHFRGRNPSAAETSTAVPARKPPFWHLWVDQESRIWVARHGRGVRIAEPPGLRARRERYGGPASEWWDPLAFDVIDAAGRFLGAIRFDNVLTRLVVAAGRLVWVIEEGADGEHYVTRYRIDSP